MQLDNKMHFVQLIPVNRIIGSLRHRTISLVLIAVNRFRRSKITSSNLLILPSRPCSLKQIDHRESLDPTRSTTVLVQLHPRWLSTVLQIFTNASDRKPFFRILLPSRLLLFISGHLCLFPVSAFVPPIIVDSSLFNE